MKVRVKRLTETASLPEYGSAGAAGADLRADLADKITIAPGETAMIPTGLSVEVPEGYAAFIYARSGMAAKRGLAPANKVGVIDSDYRGEVKIALHNHGREPQEIVPGDRVAQMVIAPVIAADFTEADGLCDTDRGEGGFGSTGTR